MLILAFNKSVPLIRLSLCFLLCSSSFCSRTASGERPGNGDPGSGGSEPFDLKATKLIINM